MTIKINKIDKEKTMRFMMSILLDYDIALIGYDALNTKFHVLCVGNTVEHKGNCTFYD